MYTTFSYSSPTSDCLLSPLPPPDSSLTSDDLYYPHPPFFPAIPHQDGLAAVADPRGGGLVSDWWLPAVIIQVGCALALAVFYIRWAPVSWQATDFLGCLMNLRWCWLVRLW